MWHYKVKLDETNMKKLKAFINHFNRLDHILIFDQNKDLKGDNFKKWLSIYTEMGSSIIVIVLIFLIAILDNFSVIYIFLPIYLFQLASVEIIKLYFNRTRPHTYVHKNLLGLSSKSGSFPSGHTSNIFCFAYLISNYYEVSLALIIILYALAGAVGMSRIFLGKHYFGDVVAGAIFGIFLAIIGAYLWILVYTHTGLLKFIV